MSQQNLWLESFIKCLLLFPVWNVIALASESWESDVSFESPDIIDNELYYDLMLKVRH